MELPPLAPFPPASVCKDISPEEWEQCLDAWLLLAQGYLFLPPEVFSRKLSKDTSVPKFLSSYVKSHTQDSKISRAESKSSHLRRTCFLLTHRCLSELKQKPPLLQEWEFLSALSVVYAESPSLAPLLRDLWETAGLGKRFQNHKSSLIQSFEAAASKGMHPELELNLAPMTALLRACPAYGQFLMLGSDFIDMLSKMYDSSAPSLKRKIVIVAYRCFSSLLEPSSPKFSMLLDHLYGLNPLRASKHSLLSAVCSNTPFVKRLRGRIAGPEAIRAEKLIQDLSRFEGMGSLPRRRRKHARTKPSKGKGKEKDEYGHGAFEGGVHVHKMSLVTQIQDLFPDLGSGFVLRLLDEYGDDPEEVTAHLLEDCLPAHLKSLDRSEQISRPPLDNSSDLVPNLSPHATPLLLPTRRNIHDNDAFDRLEISPSQIHRGLKASPLTADSMLQDRSSAPNKAAILSALAAFDSDDDERDDTYDVDDVGGTIDAAVPGSDEVDTDLKDKNEEALFRAWKMSPEAFGREAATRRGQARAALRSETGMTDEAIEGWAIMIGRDPRKLRRLEAQFEMFGGQQRALEKTKYREGEGTDESDRGDALNDRRVRGGFRGRGRGGRGGAFAGTTSVSGPADDKGTQVARQRKDANKGSRANHNRRDQRAKKMARAGFAG
ncbi:MAG: hypothetical protein Q9219_001030 [cf. Caloplaca sp. 3 TL-2023]